MFDDLEPRKPPAKPIDLSLLSVEELDLRISALEAEIARCREAIASKQTQRGAAHAMFKKGA